MKKVGRWGVASEAPADDADAVIGVSCGQVARTLWAVMVDPDTGEELPDSRIGEIWLHGKNIGRGYWGGQPGGGESANLRRPVDPPARRRQPRRGCAR